MRRPRLPHEDSETASAGIRAAMVSRSVHSRFSQKHIASWCPMLADFEVPHTIQPGEYSSRGGTDGIEHECGSVLVNVNWNDDNRKWNVNDWNPDNDVNAGRRVFSGHSQSSPPLARGSFRFKAAFPSADHAPDFVHLFRKRGVFFIIKRLHFPRNAEEEFEYVGLAYGA